jgi:hypothetical protein
MLARTLVVALALLVAQAPARAQSRSTPADVERTYPTFGVRLTGPAGWLQLAGGRPGLITRWGKPSPETGEVTSAIVVELEPAEAQTPSQYAAMVAQRSGGTVDRSTVDVAGVRGYTVTAAAGQASGVRTASTLVVKRGSLMYVVTAFETPGAPVSGEMDRVRMAWKWVPVEPVAKYVQNLSPPFPVFGKLSMSLPELARPYDVKDPSAQMHQLVFDYTANKPVVDIEMIALPAGRDANQAKEMVNQGVMEQARLAQPLTWTEQGGRPRRWVSSSFDQKSPGPVRGAPPIVTVARYAVVELSERESALLTIQYVIAKPSDRPAFEAANDAILKSIRPADAASSEGVANAGSPPPAPRGDGSISIKRKAPRKDKAASASTSTNP